MKNFSPKPYGPFYLLEQIGKGGTAKVYLGIIQEFFTESNPQASMVAIKQLLSKYAREEDFIQCLTSEAKLASILDHPNIVRVLDLGNVGTDYYLSMEWINGKSLFDLLDQVRKQDKAIATHYLLYVCKQVAKALDYAHAATDMDGRPMDIVHCDVTPHNVLVSYSGYVKLTDFGIATASKRDDQMNKDTVFGKLHYLAPEHIELKGFDYRSDIYSFGVMLYEIVTYKRPFHAKNVIELQDQIKTKAPSFNHAFFDNNPELKKFVTRCLEKDPSKRPESLAEYVDLVQHMPDVAKVTPKRMSKLIGAVLQKVIEKERSTLKDRLHHYIQNHQDPSMGMEDMTDLEDDGVVQKTEAIPKNYEHDRTKIFIKDNDADDEPSLGEIGRVALEKRQVIKVIEKPVIVEEVTAPPEDHPVVVSSSIDDYVDATLFDDIVPMQYTNNEAILDRVNKEKITQRIAIVDDDELPDTGPQIELGDVDPFTHEALDLDEPEVDPNRTIIEHKSSKAEVDPNRTWVEHKSVEPEADPNRTFIEHKSTQADHNEIDEDVALFDDAGENKATKKITITGETPLEPEATILDDGSDMPLSAATPPLEASPDLEKPPQKVASGHSDYLSNSPGAEVEEVLITGQHPFDSDIEPIRKNRDSLFSHLSPIGAGELKENTLHIQIPYVILKKTALILFAVIILGIGSWTLSSQSWMQSMWSASAPIQTIEVWVSSEQNEHLYFGQTARDIDEHWINKNLVAPAQKFLESEHKRLTQKSLPMNFQVKAFTYSTPLPSDDSLFSPHRVYQAAAVAHEINLDLPTPEVGRLFIHLFPQQEDLRQRYPFQYGGRSPEHQHLVYLPTNQSLEEAQVMVAHQLLRLMNAPILTNGKGYPEFPDGYANPQKKPLHPQNYGEIMTLMIPQSPTQSYLLDNLTKARIGQSTATTIGWAKED